MKIKALFVILILPFLSYAQLSDKLIEQRLDSLQLSVGLDSTRHSRSYIFDYTNNLNNTTETLSKFFSIDIPLKQLFLKHNIPVELRYAAISLSGCDNFYKDSDGREGFFKMRHAVAKNHGLYISNYVDERRDILKSAEAFCFELNEIYAQTKSWKLALTLYAASIQEWEKAKVLSQDSTADYYLINSYLPSVYQNEYAKFIAAIYIANYYEVHGIKVNLMRVRYEPVPIRKLTTTYQLSSKLGIDHELFKELNPTYKKGIIPNSGRDYFVNLPIHKVKEFYDYGYEAYNYSKIETYNNTEIKLIEVIPTDSSFLLEQESSKDLVEVFYSVRNGDMLLSIADYFDCEVVEIKRWNKLYSEFLEIDQRLMILVPANQEGFYKMIDKMSNAERRQIAKRD